MVRAARRFINSIRDTFGAPRLLLAAGVAAALALIYAPARALERPLVGGVNKNVTATTAATAVDYTTCPNTGNVVFVNLSATPLCTGYSTAGDPLTCAVAGDNSIRVCSDSTKCVGTMVSRDAARGALFYLVETGTLANVVIECGSIQ